MKNIIIITITSVIVSTLSLLIYHTQIIKKNYVPRADIYVVDTNQLLKQLANLYVNKAISRDEFMARARIMQDRLVAHQGLVFELGALPGRVDNNIQPEFDDLIGKIGTTK